MAGLEKWVENGDGSYDYEQGEVDVEIVVSDVPSFVDPIIIAPDLAVLDEIVEAAGAMKTLVAGIQGHACSGCEPGKIYVVDRVNVVDDDGLCLVCGGETIVSPPPAHPDG